MNTPEPARPASPSPTTPQVRNPYRHSLRVTREQIDYQGHASNTAILSWMIDAAHLHSASLGWDERAYLSAGGFFVVRRHEIDYLSFARLGDRITVFTWPSSCEKVTAERRYWVVRDGGANVVVAKGITQWIYVDSGTGRPKRIPEAIAASFEPGRFV